MQPKSRKLDPDAKQEHRREDQRDNIWPMSDRLRTLLVKTDDPLLHDCTSEDIETRRNDCQDSD